MIGDQDFVWTFPTYLLAKNFATDAAGNIKFNKNLQFIAPAVNPSGEQGIATFTDRHLAEEYLELTNPELGMRLMELRGPRALGQFLLHAPKKYRYLAVDPNRKTGIIRGLLISAVLAALEGRGDRTGQGS
jgi:hypothetical protein